MNYDRRAFAGFAAALLVVCSLAASSLAQTADGGKFGPAAKAGESFPAAPINPVYTNLPVTVECWAKLDGKDRTSVLVANELRHSGTHWDLFAQKGSGKFGAYVTGYATKEIVSDRDITDGKWHYLAMTLDGTSCVLYVDGEKVAEQALAKKFTYPDRGPLTFAYFGGDGSENVPAAGLVDEVRLSRGVRPIKGVPTSAFEADADTIGLWHFDETVGASSFADASRMKNSASPMTNADLLPKDAVTRTKWQEMDLAPFLSATIGAKGPGAGKNVAYKGIAIPLGKDKKAGVCFDTELMRWSAAWTGDFLKIYPSREGLAQHPDVGGEVLFGTTMTPGWAKPGTEDFADPRPDKLGSMPKEWMTFNGTYVHGESVVLKYDVGGVEVLESASAEASDGGPLFVRRMRIAPSKTDMYLVVCELPKGELPVSTEHGVLIRRRPSANLAVSVSGIEDNFWPAGKPGRLLHPTALTLKVPAHDHPVEFTLTFRAGNELAAAAAGGASLETRCTGGPANWPTPVVTKGTLGRGDGPYVSDTLTAPDDNPWHSFLRFGGLDFFAKGDMAICSVSGDVWVVSGIDEKLEQLKWRRYAAGLFQPLGLKIVDDKVYVLGRDRITRLHDLNGDGEADFYENFNGDCKVTENGHAYATCLETDPAGNFYYTKCADNTEHGGAVLRVSRDGSKLDVFATGVRNMNGAGAGPDGTITAADNQGEWVPASRLDVLTQGEFIGYQPMGRGHKVEEGPGKPLVWMPQNVDNSSGGQVWAPANDARWGPLAGHMLHTSYGAASLLLVLNEKVNGVDQGGVVKFPLRFDSGIMRGRFRPQDGQLYVCGLKGWQTSGNRDGALHRVRYTGKPVTMPVGLNVHQNGVRLTFAEPVDKELAVDLDSYGILQWNYKWTGDYGSRQWSVAKPEEQGYDEVKVSKATLSPDGKSIFLEIAGLKPVMQMQITYDLETAGGTEMKGDVWNTIHELGETFAFKSEPERGSDGTVRGLGASPKPNAKAVNLGEAPKPRTRDAAPSAGPTKILLIAGKKSHGPGEHEYEKGLRLLAECLNTSPNLKGVTAEVVTDGWPEDPKAFDGVDTIVLFCDGADRDEKAHPLLEGNRLDQLGALMKKGVGLVAIHYTVFVPTERGGKQFQEWLGGYFDYDSSGNVREKWYSRLGHATTTSTLLAKDHPIARGVEPFTTKTEYYWRMHFRDDDKRLTPLLTFDPKGGLETTVAWAVERADGGRGFGFTEGHFHSNWRIDGFRKFVLNGIVWTAKQDVPEGGVQSTVTKE